jgi:hypothetical protein
MSSYSLLALVLHVTFIVKCDSSARTNQNKDENPFGKTLVGVSSHFQKSHIFVLLDILSAPSDIDIGMIGSRTFNTFTLIRKAFSNTNIYIPKEQHVLSKYLFSFNVFLKYLP